MRLYPLPCYSKIMNEMTGKKLDQSINIDQPGIYRIRIQGKLSAGTIRRFDEMAAVVELNADGIPITTLTGQISDQAALHGIVARVRDLGLPLILVELVSTVDNGG